MRLIRRFPVLEPALHEGRLNATQLIVLGPILTAENVDELVRRATHLSKEKTKELAVTIRPKEVPADGIRRLPAPVTGSPAATEPPTADVPEVTHLDVGLRILEPAAQDDLRPPALVARPVIRSQMEPVAARRWQWRIGLDERRKEKVDRLRGYLSHKIPDGDLEKIFDQMLEDSLERHGKRLGFEEPVRPRKQARARPVTPGERAHVPLAVRREVMKRDGYRCTWIGADGERCPCTTRLEMDHLEPARETGSSTADDLTTRCRVHNQYRARQRYGAEYVRRRIEDARRAREAKRTNRWLCEPVAPWQSSPEAPSRRREVEPGGTTS